MHTIEIDGMPADLGLLEERLTAEVGQVTTFLASDGRVRGLDLHLTRLARASRDPLGPGVDPDMIEQAVRAFVRSRGGTLLVRVELFHVSGDAAERVLVMGREAPPVTDRPLRLRAVPSTGPALGFDRRHALAAGYDDVLLHDPGGTVSECPSGAIGFLARGRVIWPQTRAPGVERQLLHDQLRADGTPSAVLPVRPDDLRLFDAGFLVGNHGVSLVEAVDDLTLTDDETSLTAVRDAFARIPWQDA
ncbi:aminotransferase class IV [Leifsonia sp. NPDC058248]|uniref:aminotransferase class IV n=1 Tax=Leifsonia sp. NPDC058248 TaxID=3346402 RepID=UPI0036DE5DAA